MAKGRSQLLLIALDARARGDPAALDAAMHLVDPFTGKGFVLDRSIPGLVVARSPGPDLVADHDGLPGGAAPGETDDLCVVVWSDDWRK